MSASISIFSKCIRTTLALLLITCYHALELAILLKASNVRDSTSRKRHEKEQVQKHVKT